MSRRRLLRGIAVLGAALAAGVAVGDADAARRSARPVRLVRPAGTSTGGSQTGSPGTGSPGGPGAPATGDSQTGAPATGNTTGGGNTGQDNETTTNTPGTDVTCTVTGEVVVDGVVVSPETRTGNCAP